MAKVGIGYSGLTDRVYLGKQNKEKGLWIGDKQDITSDFLFVVEQFFEIGSLRTINNSAVGQSLFIHIENNRESIKKLLQHLEKELGQPKEN